MHTNFFLGSNSKDGFHSFYDDLTDLKEAKTVYILKGSPGSGKSSIMRRVAKRCEEKGEKVEYYLCSSDPDSLDAITIPSKGVSIVDGTAPHVVEPRYPLAVERYINLGDFADCSELIKIKDKIIEVRDRYSEFFSHIYKLTSACGAIDNELFDIALGAISISKLHKKADGIIRREIREDGSKSAVLRRFCSAFSKSGIVFTLGVSENDFTTIFLVEDSFGLAHFILSPILDALSASNFTSIACYDHLVPERLSHLLVPELSLAFVTSNAETKYNGQYTKKIRLDAMLDHSTVKREKKRILRLRKARENIVSDISHLLDAAKVCHDELEALYNPYIDFDAVYSFADSLADEILK